MSWFDKANDMIAARKAERDLERKKLKMSGERPRIVLLTSAELKREPKRLVCIICATPHERLDEYTIVKKCAC